MENLEVIDDLFFQWINGAAAPALAKRMAKRGRGLDIQKVLAKTGQKFHWPGYQYLGSGTHLQKRFTRGDPGINRLDRLAKQHDINYARAKNLRDKHAADRKMIQALARWPKKTKPEKIV